MSEADYPHQRVVFLRFYPHDEDDPRNSDQPSEVITFLRGAYHVFDLTFNRPQNVWLTTYLDSVPAPWEVSVWQGAYWLSADTDLTVEVNGSLSQRLTDAEVEKWLRGRPPDEFFDNSFPSEEDPPGYIEENE